MVVLLKIMPAQLVTAGADVLVAGTTVFKASDPIQMIATLKTIK
jgi:pentose-5-phosphate-3-epimerase